MALALGATVWCGRAEGTPIPPFSLAVLGQAMHQTLFVQQSVENKDAGNTPQAAFWTVTTFVAMSPFIGPHDYVPTEQYLQEQAGKTGVEIKMSGLGAAVGLGYV